MTLVQFSERATYDILLSASRPREMGLRIRDLVAMRNVSGFFSASARAETTITTIVRMETRLNLKTRSFHQSRNSNGANSCKLRRHVRNSCAVFGET